MLSQSLYIQKTLRPIYVVLLISISVYMFITGYTDYNTQRKLASAELVYSEDEELVYSEDEKDIARVFKNNDRFYNIPKKFSKIKSSIKKHNLKEDKNESDILEGNQVANLMQEMLGSKYDLNKVKKTKEVPGFFIDELPKDIAYIPEATTRKEIFISIVLPLVVEANRDIALKRSRLINIYNKLAESNTITFKEHNWLIDLAVKYSIPTKHVYKIDIARDLLEHIDIIPNSIAIAQAAKESGWGTSRFAKEGNALFGQWTYDNANGLLPARRTDGEDHLIKSFKNLRLSVVSYMENINSHGAYKSFRKKRAEIKDQNNQIRSIILVDELDSYAESPNYTEILKLIIEKNELYIFDDVKLIDQSSLV